MASALGPVTALLISVAILLMGNGLQSTLLPVRANIEAFSTLQIGILGSFYFLGFAAGCLMAPYVVRRVGHIRAFTAMVSIASAVALAHAMAVSPYVWWPLRAMTGFCFAALFMIIESWLNERSTNETRGFVFSIYAVINLTVLTLGQLMIVLDSPTAFTLFAVSSILVSLAAVPVAMTTAPAPAPIDQVGIRIGRLFKTSPVGFAGCFVVGAVNGCFWSLGPLFAQESGLSVGGIAVFMSVTVIAGAIGQYPLGRASDKTDRRRIIVGIALAAAAAGIALVTVAPNWPPGTLVFSFLFGAFAFPLYAVSVAHTNDHVSPQDYVEVAGGLLLLYALGAVVGPMAASGLMARFGPNSLFAFTAATQTALALFVLVRMQVRDRAPAADRGDFTDSLVATATLSPMDPAAFDEVDEQDAAAATGR
ncbi:MAG: MFS transporter [Inquilinus sp.]|nr:MFS transporter [Inquilinus sp.]